MRNGGKFSYYLTKLLDEPVSCDVTHVYQKLDVMTTKVSNVDMN